MDRGPLAIVALGLVVLLVGGVRLARLGHFSWTQAGLCLLAVPVCIAVLLVTDYTLHHSKIGFVMMLAMMAAIGVSSPVFCVGLGITLVGMVVTKWP